MNRSERLRYEMLLRVRDFGSTRGQQFPPTSEAGRAFAAVAQATAQIDAHAKAKLLTREEGKKARAAVRREIEERLKIVARTARIVARATPGADSKFRFPVQKSGVATLTAARAVIDEGQTALDRFVPFGMPANIVAELQALADRYEQADRERRAGKNGFAAALAGTRAALATATEALRVLDVVVVNTAGTDSALLGAWHEARRVAAPAKVPPRIATPSVTKTDSQAKAPIGGAVQAPATSPVPTPTEPAEPPTSAEPALRRVS